VLAAHIEADATVAPGAITAAGRGGAGGTRAVAEATVATVATGADHAARAPGAAPRRGGVAAATTTAGHDERDAVAPGHHRGATAPAR
jgi:hypothetical protein